MTQRDLDREVARATGESIGTIRSMGFSLVEPSDPEPQTVDWDAIDEERVGVFPAAKKSRYMSAAA